VAHSSSGVGVFLVTGGNAKEDFASAFSKTAKSNDRTLITRTLFETQRRYLVGIYDAHIVEDTRKINTFVDGSYPLLQAIIMRDNLHEFCEAHPELKDTINPLLQVMKTTCEIEGTAYKRPEDYETNSSLLDAQQDDAAQLISTKLQKMAPGTSILIPAGNHDHAVSFEFKKDHDDTLTCHLYNTGEGCAFHSRENLKYLPITWSNIPSQHLDSECIRKLRYREREIKMDESVARWRSLLGAEDKDAARRERPYREQGALYSCTYKSLAVWLHTAMNRIDPSGLLYERFKQETTTQLLKRFDAQFPLNTPVDIPLSIDELQGFRERAEQVRERRADRTQFLDICKQAKSAEELSNVRELLNRQSVITVVKQRMRSEDIEELIDKATVHDNKELVKAICRLRQDVSTFSEACSEVKTKNATSQAAAARAIKKIESRLEKNPLLLLEKTKPIHLEKLVDAAMITGGHDVLINTVLASGQKIAMFPDAYRAARSESKFLKVVSRLKANPGLASSLSAAEWESFVDRAITAERSDVVDRVRKYQENSSRL